MTNYALSAEEKAKFDAQGFIGPFKLFEPDEAKALWKNTLRTQLMRRDTSVFPDSLLNYDRHLDIKAIQDIVTSPKIVDRLKSILGQEILCWRTEWFPKYPGEAGTEWHQAKRFFEFEGQPKLSPSMETQEKNEYWVLTVWLAFTDVTKETAAMKFMPGSHKQEWFFDESRKREFDANSKADSGFFGYSWEGLKIDKDWKPDDSKAVNMEVKAGEFFIFTSKCLHGSFPNSSQDKARFAMSARYVLPEVPVYKDLETFNALNEVLKLDKYRPLLVSGSGATSVNRYELPH